MTFLAIAQVAPFHCSRITGTIGETAIHTSELIAEFIPTKLTPHRRSWCTAGLPSRRIAFKLHVVFFSVVPVYDICTIFYIPEIHIILHRFGADLLGGGLGLVDGFRECMSGTQQAFETGVRG